MYSAQTSLAFTHSSKRRQRPLQCPSSSSTSLSFLENPSNNIEQHRRFDIRKHEDNPNSNWLTEIGLPRGLRNVLLDNIEEVSTKRIWIVDNSGSMKMMDGHEILPSIDGNKNKKNKERVLVPRSDLTNSAADGDTTRWAELQETVLCHAQLLSILGAPTDFRLLNPPSNGGPQKFRVGYDKNNIQWVPSIPSIFRWIKQSDSSNPTSNNNTIKMPSLPSMPSLFGRKRQSDSNRVEKIMNRNKPKGKTPLHEAVLDVRADVVRMLPQLHADGMKVTIVICTDGCSNDALAQKNENGEPTAPVEPYRELEDALESLQGLPVNVVIRLCTDYGEVVDFYNGLDQRMGESSFLDVIDDYEAEAAQVYGQNPWLNYALVLHRMRELGLQGSSGLFDFLDQRPFTGDEIREFVAMLFGTTVDLLPDPLCDWENFVMEIDRLQQCEKMHWNPAKMAITPWIDTEELMAMQ